MKAKLQEFYIVNIVATSMFKSKPSYKSLVLGTPFKIYDGMDGFIYDGSIYVKSIGRLLCSKEEFNRKEWAFREDMLLKTEAVYIARGHHVDNLPFEANKLDIKRLSDYAEEFRDIFGYNIPTCISGYDIIEHDRRLMARHSDYVDGVSMEMVLLKHYSQRAVELCKLLIEL